MKINLFFKNAKPVSVNSYLKKGKTGSVYKNQAALAFEQRIFFQLMPKRKELEEFEKNLDDRNFHLSASITMYKPIGKIFTKKGRINKRGGDFDNSFKQIIDSIFKIFQKIDDSIILHHKKNEIKISPDNEFHLKVSLEYRDNDLLREKLDPMDPSYDYSTK